MSTQLHLLMARYLAYPKDKRAQYLSDLSAPDCMKLLQELENGCTHEKCSLVWKKFLQIINTPVPNCPDEKITSFVSNHINYLLTRFNEYFQDPDKLPVELPSLIELFKNRIKNIEDSQITVQYIENLMRAIDACVVLEMIALQLPKDIRVSIPEFDEFEDYSNSEIVDRIDHWIEKNINALLKLKRLEIADNPIRYIPSFLSKLANLEELIIDNTDIDTLSDSILKLKKLKTLTIFNNKSLLHLPEKIKDLKLLNTLKLGRNALIDLPDSVCDLTNLQMLAISYNKFLTILPDRIGDLQSLKILFLDHNLLTYLPDSICELKELFFLDISANKLEELPEDIGNLQNLETFIIYKNQIKSVPSSAKNLINLIKIQCDKGLNRDDFPTLKIYTPGKD